jgi:hypothetical protein
MQGSDPEEPEDGLKVLGYMPGHVHYKVGTVEDVRRASACIDWEVLNVKSRAACQKTLQQKSRLLTQSTKFCMPFHPDRSQVGGDFTLLVHTDLCRCFRKSLFERCQLPIQYHIRTYADRSVCAMVGRSCCWQPALT